MGALDTAQSVFLRFHQFVYEGTNGWIGHRMIGLPSLLLRTTGRKTGTPRTSALVYARDGDEYVVVASNGGSDKPPGWLHNVRAKPDVVVQLGRRRSNARGRIVECGDADYERLWRLANDNNGGRYERYQARTQRPIAVVALLPVSGG